MSEAKVSGDVGLNAMKESEGIGGEHLNIDAESIEMRNPQIQICKDCALIGNRFHRVATDAEKRCARLVNTGFRPIVTRGVV